MTAILWRQIKVKNMENTKKLNRAAILPLPGDPFLFNYWLKSFKNWEMYIDRLYVYLNTPAEPAVVHYIRDLCNKNPKISLQYNDQQVPHGVAINRTLDIVNEESILLVEDDFFILKGELIDRAFKLIESGEWDIVGSQRGSCSMEILRRAFELWNVKYEGMGDQGCNFWPCLFFSKKQTLLDTDRNFDSKMWPKGVYIPELDYTPEVDLFGDTFVNTSLQLRAKGLKVAYLPQYHAHPDDIEHYNTNTGIFDGKTPWVHIGSLSSGMSGVLMDENGRPLSRRLIDEPKDGSILPDYVKTEMEKQEFERRVQIWLSAYESAMPNEEIVEFYDLYGKALQRVVGQYHLRIKRIRLRQEIYKRALGL